MQEVCRTREVEDMRLAGGADPYYNIILDLYIVNGGNPACLRRASRISLALVLLHVWCLLALVLLHV